MAFDKARAYAPHPDDFALTAALCASKSQLAEARVRALQTEGHLDLPRPGGGATWHRFRRIAEIAADDLSLARLAEGHADAISVLAEAGLGPYGGLYGVWAAGAPLALQDSAVYGEREYCSGAGMVDRALVTAEAEGESALFEVDAQSRSVVALEGTWPAIGMAATRSETLAFQGVPVERQVGPSGFYTGRPGFWNGSPNVAACWFGGALGLARGLVSRAVKEPWQFALLGEVDSLVTEMRACLQAAANDIDARPDCSAEERELRAFRVRDAIYRGCCDVLRYAAEAGGTAMSTHDPAQIRRLVDLPVYLRQHHPARDRERIGRLVSSPPPCEGANNASNRT